MEEQSPNDSYSHVLKYTGIFGGVQGLKILVDVSRNKLAALLLGRVGMGLNGIFVNISEILNSWTNFGIPFYTVRRVAELYEVGTDEELKRFVSVIRTWSIWSSLLGALLCLGLASWLSNHYLPEGGHIPEIMLLSLFVASMPIEAVECSLLKGLRRLRTVALIDVLSAFSAFVFSIPLYYLMGLRGIVLSLVLCGWSVAIIHLYFSVRIIPYKVKLFSHQVLAEGLPIIRIGLPYVLAAAALAVTTGEVYSYINDASQIGLYRSGFALMVAYSGIIFKAVEADYFPRLSGVNHDTLRLNHTINQQIDVCVLLMAPMLIFFILVIPLAIRILYSSEFLPVIPMVVAAIFHLLIKAITTPISYTPLAKADTWLYLIMECSYYLVFLLMIRYGIDQYGLIGAGWAMSFASVFELIILLGVYCPIYGYKMRRSTILLIVPQALLLIATVALCLLASNVIKYSVGSVSLILSLLFSWRRLSPQLAVVQRINGYVLATTRTLKRIFGFRS